MVVEVGWWGGRWLTEKELTGYKAVALCMVSTFTHTRQHPAQNASTQGHDQPAPTDI